MDYGRGSYHNIPSRSQSVERGRVEVSDYDPPQISIHWYIYQGEAKLTKTTSVQEECKRKHHVVCRFSVSYVVRADGKRSEERST